MHDTKTVLVTGGAGFIGSHLVDALIEGGRHTVVVIDNFSWGKEENLAHHADSDRLTIYRRDVRSDLADIFASHRFDAVFHLAALHKVQYSIQYPDETHDVNINGTVNLLHACRAHGVKRFIFSSSAAVYGAQPRSDLSEEASTRPLSPYGLHKAAAEQYCALYAMLYGLETISLRYFNAFGPRQDARSGYAGVIPIFMSQLASGTRPVINGDGTQTRDFVPVGDIVDANLRAMECSDARAFGAAFNIGSGRAVSVRELYEKIAKLHNHDGEPEYGPEVLEIRHQRAIAERAREILGWEARTDFDDALLNTHLHFLQEHSPSINQLV